MTGLEQQGEVTGLGKQGEVTRLHCKNDLVNITNFCHRYHQKTSKMVIFVAKVGDVHQIVFTV